MILFKNNAYSTFAGGIASGATSFACQAGHGDRFPVVAAPDVAYITFEDSGGNREVVKVTARGSGSDTFTIVRAQDGTAARAWLAGDVVEQRIVALELDRFERLQMVNAADSKTTPVDVDEIGLIDSAASYGLKKLTLANLKATLKTYFDTLYAKIGAVTGTGITMATGKLLGRNTASTGAIEEITLGTGLSMTGTTLNGQVQAVASVGGFTGAVTAANLMTAINTVDGAGSGLDADLLDGQSSAYYATAASVTGKLAADLGSGSFPVGVILCGGFVTSGGSVAVGSTTTVLTWGGAGGPTTQVLSGTWRNIGSNVIYSGPGDYTSAIQRIA